jgi:lysozyme
MNISQAGIDRLELREGKRLQSYKDTRGFWTVGIGHLGPPAGPGVTLTDDQVMALFAADLKPFELAVNEAIKVPITQNQFDACVSLAFNIGARGFTGSTVVHKINTGDIEGAAAAFLMWRFPPELLGRRIDELHQFLT